MFGSVSEGLDATIAKLDDSSWVVRLQALTALDRAGQAALKLHAEAIVAKLDDSDGYVR